MVSGTIVFRGEYHTHNLQFYSPFRFIPHEDTATELILPFWDISMIIYI